MVMSGYTFFPDFTIYFRGYTFFPDFTIYFLSRKVFRLEKISLDRMVCVAITSVAKNSNFLVCNKDFSSDLGSQQY